MGLLGGFAFAAFHTLAGISIARWASCLACDGIELRRDDRQFRRRVAYPPGIPTIQRAFQPALAGRGYEIHARIARPTGQEEGVLTTFGSVETGWTLFIDHDVFDLAPRPHRSSANDSN